MLSGGSGVHVWGVPGPCHLDSPQWDVVTPHQPLFTQQHHKAKQHEHTALAQAKLLPACMHVLCWSSSALNSPLRAALTRWAASA